MNAKPRTSSAGFMLTEALVGMFVIACIMGGVMVALHAQTRAATHTVRRTRCRLLLEGELEVMRGLPASGIRPRRNERFEPALGTPEGLQDVVFRRTVQREEKGRLTRVTLLAMKEDDEESREWMRIEGVIFMPMRKVDESD